MSGPQPLSRVNPKAEYRSTLGIAYADLYPDLYHIAQRVIAIASFGEQMWGHIFGNLLHAAPLPSHAIYQRLDSASAKKAILMAAAEAQLSDMDYRWLQALQRAIAPAYKVRHQIAHHLWGDSPQIPDSLLLADPIIMLEPVKWGHQSVILASQGKPFNEVANKAMELDRSKIVVWSKDALLTAVENMTAAVTCIRLMSEICLPGYPESAREQARGMLLKWPRFAESLENIQSKIPPVSL